MNKFTASCLLFTSVLYGCSLAPDFKLPELHLPQNFKEESTAAAPVEGSWKPAESLEKNDRGEWWKIFENPELDDLEKQTADNNQTLKAATARVEEARALAQANTFSLLPDLTLGGNAVRSQPSAASLVPFGAPANSKVNPYTLFSATGVASYEADLFGGVRENYHAFNFDADAQAATYRSVLLALQADVAQTYFSLRTLDSERQLLNDTVSVREEALRIMQHRFEQGEASGQDQARSQNELASAKSDLIIANRQRATLDHALAIMLGKLPSEFTLAEAPLKDIPPEIPAGLPSRLLERRPDITAAQLQMAAANARVGVARAAFFPSLILTASGGYESTELGTLFHWSNRAWALGQLADAALTFPVFDNGRNQAHLDQAHAAFNEALANYRQQVLVAFQDVENNLSDQRLLADQSQQQDIGAAATERTNDLTRKRYDVGDVSFFEIVNTQRDMLAAERGALETRGQRIITTILLIRALGGGWDSKPASIPATQDIPLSSGF